MFLDSWPLVSLHPTATMEEANPLCIIIPFISAGDSCETIEAKFGITAAEFLAWNPAVSADCETNFWVDEAYCVGVSS